MMQTISRYHPWKKFDSWLFTIAYHKCMDHFRMQKRMAPADGTGWDRPDPASQLDEDVTVSVAVGEALSHLSAVQREAVLLHYYHQFSAKEIARMTNTLLPTVKSRLSAAKKLLLNDLREEFQ